MPTRSTLRQSAIAIIISVAFLLFLGFVAWFVHRADGLYGHGPLPSPLDSTGGYTFTLLITLLGIVAGASVRLAVLQAKHVIGKFGWVVYFLVLLPLVFIVFLPILRFGSDPIFGLPLYLVSPEGRIVFAIALGTLVFGNIDLRLLIPGLTPSRSNDSRLDSPDGTVLQGLPGRFTPPAWRALSVMQEEAKRYEHAYMGTEHLILGLIRNEDSIATKVLVNLGVRIDDVRSQVEGVIGRRGSLYTGSTGMTRRCQRVIERAARLSRIDGLKVVGTGQILHALVEEPEDGASQILISLGVSSNRVAGEIQRLGPEPV
jgi:hypothetical protein